MYRDRQHLYVRGAAKRWGARLFLSASMAVLSSAAAFAQDKPPGEAGVEATDENSVSTLVVTARKREESAQRVGETLSVFSGKQLELLGAADASSLAASVPNLVIGTEKYDLKVMIRGVGSDNVNAYNDPGVAFHIDGVYQARPSGGTALFYDLARVEVLRGPQGTLYGRNATGGALNLISNQPKTDAYEVLGDVAYGNYNSFNLRGVANIPIVQDKLALRLTGTWAQRDGTQKNLFPRGTTGDDLNEGTWRAQLLFTPTEKLKLVLRASGVDKDGTGNGRKRLAPPAGSNCQDCIYVPTIPDLRTVYKDTAESLNMGSRAYSAELNYDLGPADLTLIAGHQKFHLDGLADVDQELRPATVPGGITMTGSLVQRSEQDTYEARFASNGSGRFEWLVGGFYMEEKALQITEIRRNQPPGGNNLINNLQDISSRSIAGFGQVGYQITDTLKVIGGARYSSDHKSGVGGSLIFVGPTFNVRIPSSTNSARSDGSWSEATYKGGLEWQVRPDHLIYASVSSGYKAGGFNLGRNVYKPEKILAYEVGSKSNFDNFTLNLSAFYYDYTDLQVYQVVDGVTQVLNAGGARVYGVEAEGRYRVNHALSFDGNVGYLHATYTDFMQASPIFLDVPPPANVGHVFDLRGKSLVNAPRWSGRLGVQYTTDLAGGVLTARAQGSYQSDVYFRSLNFKPNDGQEAFAKMDLRLLYERDFWSIEAFANNVTNKTTLSNIEVTGSGIYLGNLAPPRMYGLRLGMRFGG